MSQKERIAMSPAICYHTCQLSGNQS